MKIVRYINTQGLVEWGCIENNGDITILSGDLFNGLQPTNTPASVQSLLSPLQPAQILCIGLNYRRHAEETKAAVPERPILFIKAINSLNHPGQPIPIPQRAPSSRVDYECELAIVIGKTCKNVSEQDALDYVLGYTCANDVSARDHQIKWGGSQWCRGKSFDGFCPLGPCLVTPDDIPDPDNLSLQTRLNGRVMQDSNTSDMIFPVRHIISFLSASCTLPAGTVILTGTPEGVGMSRKPDPVWLQPGDTVEIEIEKIGTLSNPVTLES